MMIDIGLDGALLDLSTGPMVVLVWLVLTGAYTVARTLEGWLRK